MVDLKDYDFGEWSDFVDADAIAGAVSKACVITEPISSEAIRKYASHGMVSFRNAMDFVFVCKAGRSFPEKSATVLAKLKCKDEDVQKYIRANAGANGDQVSCFFDNDPYRVKKSFADGFNDTFFEALDFFFRDRNRYSRPQSTTATYSCLCHASASRV
jgi:hypothetical protein